MIFQNSGQKSLVSDLQRCSPLRLEVTYSNPLLSQVRNPGTERLSVPSSKSWPGWWWPGWKQISGLTGYSCLASGFSLGPEAVIHQSLVNSLIHPPRYALSISSVLVVGRGKKKGGIPASVNLTIY